MNVAFSSIDASSEDRVEVRKRSERMRAFSQMYPNAPIGSTSKEDVTSPFEEGSDDPLGVRSVTPALTVIQNETVQLDDMILKVNTFFSDAFQEREKEKEKTRRGTWRWEDRQRRLFTLWAIEILPEWKRRGSVPPEIRKVWRVGVPPLLRGEIWSLAIGNEICVTPSLVSLYSQRAKQTRSSYTLDHALRSSAIYLIELDLQKTFPHLSLFRRGAPLSKKLRDLLEAFNAYRPDIGYVRGMSNIGGVLLLYMEYSRAFVCFANLMNAKLLSTLFRVDWEGMREYVQVCARVCVCVLVCVRMCA